jgi:hypothetical protein
LQFISYLIPLVTTIFGLLIPINALNLKTNLGRTFLTDEQRIKVRYFNTIVFSLIMAFGIEYFLMVLKINIKHLNQIGSTEIASALVWGTFLFLIFLIITSPLFKWIDNFFIKTHIKFKLIPTDEIGQIYILRMHDKDTCICSKDPNAEYSSNDTYILIPMEKIMGKHLIQEKITKPQRSVWSKLFDL